MEVNIWIFQHGGSQPVAIPIRKPTCSGEGHQDNAIKFTVPEDFTKLGAKIPGFKGCNADSKPMCTLQVYAHSVESRTYSLAFPIIIPGHEASLSTASAASIQVSSKDPWLDLANLQELCLSTTDPSADIASASPRWARLVSDVYNHAYQNSDFSPYSGQQHEAISRNLQASAINKMVTGNRGELGRSILPSATYSRLKKLQSLEDSIYKNYESIANKVIKRIGNSMKTTGKLVAGSTTQPLANCFRCEEVGSTNTNRQETNTYIPSFQLPDSLVATARGMVSSKYSSLITPSGKVQIYVAALTDLLPFFFSSYSYGIIYQEAVLKTNIQAKPDATDFIKVDADGKLDKGVYASTMAKKEFASSLGCPSKCLWGSQGFRPIINGATATSVTEECSKCTQLFLDYHRATPPRVTTLGRAIVTGGLPAGFGKDQIADYPDTDGSPRVGRPPTVGQSPVLPTNSTWDLGPAAPTPPPTAVPAPTPKPPAPTPAPPSGSTRRRRRRSRNGDQKPSRRRRGSRRRRRRSNAEPPPSRRRRGSRQRRRRSNAVQSNADVNPFSDHLLLADPSDLINRVLDEQTDDMISKVLGDIKPLPMADDCK
jgi:hypothetical protein